jgi:hypothetical protein
MIQGLWTLSPALFREFTRNAGAAPPSMPLTWWGEWGEEEKKGGMLSNL